MPGCSRAARSSAYVERLAWGEAWTNTGYVVTAEDGHPPHPERIKAMFGELVAQAGVRRIRFHDLRHTSPDRSTAQSCATAPPTLCCASMPTSIKRGARSGCT